MNAVSWPLLLRSAVLGLVVDGFVIVVFASRGPEHSINGDHQH